MKILKVGLIGCGRIGTLLEQDSLRGKPCTHAGGFQSLPSAQLTAGCDINASRLKTFSRQWSIDRLYTNYREMLKNENLDIVCIATWTNLHSEMVLESVRSGVRGIFCEKPIALDLKQAKKMVQVCENNNIPLIINHERRWEIRYQTARKLIQSGKIGELRTIIGNALSWKPAKLPASQYGGGALFHDGTHLTDLFNFFCGPVDWVMGFERRPYGRKHIEETAYALMHFKNGALGFIEGGGARKYFNFELDIQGSEGRILIGNAGQELYLTKKSKRFTGFQELEQVPFSKSKRNESPFIGGARDMVRCVKKKSNSLSSGKDGLKALEIIMAVYHSAQTNGRKIKITDPKKTFS